MMRIVKDFIIFSIPVLGVVIGIEYLVVNNKDSFHVFPPQINDVQGMIWSFIGWGIFWGSITIWYKLKRKNELKESSSQKRIVSSNE